MAQRVEVRLVDDIDQEAADGTVQFGLDGVAYEIDLSNSNAEQLRGALSPWIGHARRVKGQRNGRKAPTSPASNGGPSAADVRAWAAEQGIQLSSRGRVPLEVRKAYADAH